MSRDPDNAEAEVTGEEPALLRLLLGTVDDLSIFDMSGVDDPPAFRKDLREAWALLYDNAACCWLNAFHPEEREAEPAAIGPQMCARHDALSSCWLESFRDAIVQTADRKDLPGKKDREFLYFMLGVLQAGWETYLGLRHGKIKDSEFSA